MTRQQINLMQPGAYDELQKLAARLGFIQRHGQRAGEGSVVKMLEALAKARAAAPTDESALFEKMLAAYLEWGDPDA